MCGQYRVFIEDEWRSFVDSKPSGPTVHSLLLHYKWNFCKDKSLEFLCNFKLVQVLDLCSLTIEGFPTVVTTCVHLRYLALCIFPSGVTVPSEISNLWNLETLLIDNGSTVRIPYDVWKMKRLRHVKTRNKAYVELDDVVSGGVLSQLPDLEFFRSLVIPPGKDGEKLLRKLPNVRKLSCHFEEYNQISKQLDILTKLESLGMEGCFPFPYTISFPLTIRKLTLESFKLCWNEFTTVIQKLPTLQVLVLIKMPSDGAKIWDVQYEEFPNIKSLKLVGLDIEEWKVSIDSFPCVEKLELYYCKHLIEVPPCFGEVPALKSVVVCDINKRVVDSALQIQKDQQDSGNEINIEVHKLV